MKRLQLMLLGALLMTAPTYAQIGSNNDYNPNTDSRNVTDKATNLWDKTKDAVSNTTKKVKERLGLDDEETARLRVQYMPIYKVNKYTERGSEYMVEKSREAFYKRYPNSTILSAVIPQEKWERVGVHRNGDVVGYLETIYCYVLAMDGNDGYLNAEYKFQRYKKVGETFKRVQGKWPEFSRVDSFSSDVYFRIKE